jgi:hypothetical protein
VFLGTYGREEREHLLFLSKRTKLSYALLMSTAALYGSVSGGMSA